MEAHSTRRGTRPFFFFPVVVTPNELKILGGEKKQTARAKTRNNKITLAYNQATKKREKSAGYLCLYLHEPKVRALDVVHRARTLLQRLHDTEYQRPVPDLAVVARARCSSL